MSERKCPVDGRPVVGAKQKRYCSDRCRDAAYRSVHKEDLKVRKAAFYLANRDKIAFVQRAWRLANQAKLTAYRIAHKEERSATWAAWYIANRERVLDSAARYGFARRRRRKLEALQHELLSLQRFLKEKAS